MTARYLGLGVLAVLAIAMMAQSSATATDAYRHTEQRKEMGQLDQDIQDLQREVDRAKSLQAIQQTPVKEGMEPAGSVEMVEAGEVAGVSTERTP